MASASTSTSLKEYLKKYQPEPTDQSKKKKKKKKNKPNPNPVGTGVLVVDEDPVWQKPIIEEEEESADDEKPLVDEDIEVKRMKRLEAARSRKPYHGISEDGSGWVSISEQSKNPNDVSRDSDLSPPRQRRARLDTPSPERDGDLSPPRHRRRRADTPSPDRDGDISPPRQRRRRADTPSPDKVDEDLSPPRRNRNRMPDGDLDLSPTRRRAAADLSPPRRKREASLAKDVDLSPPRKRKELKNEDLSPPRKKREQSVAKEQRIGGLMSAEAIKAENEKKRKDERARFASMDASMSGKGAEAVFRNKEGKRVTKEELLKAHEEEKPKEQKLEWGKGLAQKREAEAKLKELELEKDKPFARTRDDPELDKMLKQRIRWGDPMAHLVKHKSTEPFLEDLGTDEKMKESGFIIPQSIPSHSWIKRGIDFPPNRYGIRPGRHWDGVDRSNGFEKEQFKRQNEKRATEAEAYLWSVADM